ncbi:MAG: hypothetical protein GX283_05500 [Clostridiaceae bacterium]|jgi:hypothetical protein|nr:hypothetical protein [Clostridiaceae bacterium]
MQTKVGNLKLSRTIIIFLTICLVTIFLNTSYANMLHEEPSVIVSIDSNGNCTTEGDLFGNEQLYPGKTITGIIRIISNSDTSIKISSMSLDIDIIEHKKEYQKETVYDSFTNNLYLSLDKGFTIFNDNIIGKKSLSSFTSGEGCTFNGDKQLNIIPGKPTELLYILSMSEEAGNELESVISLITIIFRTEYSDEPTPTPTPKPPLSRPTTKPRTIVVPTISPEPPTPIISIAPTITHVPTVEPSKAPAKIASDIDVEDIFEEQSIPDEEASYDETEVIIIQEDEVHKTLPKTGEIPPIIFYGLGAGVIYAGIKLNQKKQK